MSEGHRMVPVWFFVGVILLIYGVLILRRASTNSLTLPPPCLRICIPQSGGEPCSPSWAAFTSISTCRENPEALHFRDAQVVAAQRRHLRLRREFLDQFQRDACPVYALTPHLAARSSRCLPEG